MRTRQPSGKDLSTDLPIYKLSDDDPASQPLSMPSWSAVPTVDDEIWGQTGLKRDVAACFHAPYIEFGYRTNYSLWETFLSLFSFHNESTNIWTHLIGFICVSLVGVHVLVDYHLQNGHNGKEIGLYGTLIFETYITCAALCLGLSSAYHWFGCYSVDCHRTLLRLDLTGVGLLVAGSFFPAVYYGFYCQPRLQTAYLLLSTGVLIVGLVAPWIETKVNGAHIRPYIFASLVAIGVIPCSHWAVITPKEYKDNLLMVRRTCSLIFRGAHKTLECSVMLFRLLITLLVGDPPIIFLVRPGVLIFRYQSS